MQIIAGGPGRPKTVLFGVKFAFRATETASFVDFGLVTRRDPTSPVKRVVG
jgi:hypothetical protein